MNVSSENINFYDQQPVSRGWGIYIHIPFCKQACHYCDFHFSTTIKNKDRMVFAICKELQLRVTEIQENTTIETIYFGGGTPSVLSSDALQCIIDTVFEHYNVSRDVEITLEANPDDLTAQKILKLSKTKINRLSIGIQSFFDEDLRLMNRVHNAEQAKQSVLKTQHYYENISIDLIYGIPGMSSERWTQNLDMAIDLNTPHISSYALTVEPNTALASFVSKGIVAPVTDELAQEHFEILVSKMENANFINYEFSNFGKPGYLSKNNTAYWQGKSYLGIGPSAHSYNGLQRSWNINNNSKYLKSLENNELPLEVETLSLTDRYNEYIMTGLRTIWGVSLQKIKTDFGNIYHRYILQQAQKYLDQHLLYLDNDILLVTKKGKFLSDGIASDLFLVNLK